MLEQDLETTLELRAVEDLLGLKFRIPSYQRGYRWEEEQVAKLLFDIWEGAKCPSRPKCGTIKDHSFYCLQPLVVTEKYGDSKTWYEVVDGQQRLTTIRIILAHINSQRKAQNAPVKMFDIRYETRPGSDGYFASLDDETQAKENTDAHHMHRAFLTIQKWFAFHAEITGSQIEEHFLHMLLKHVKFIWYQTDEKQSGDDATRSVIDVFTRLNVGKINLTNAELVRALFLREDNFTDTHAERRQLEIATEWDGIERRLQDSYFWGFIHNSKEFSGYETRIEYIFDLMQKKEKGHTHYFTFNAFSKQLYKVNVEDKTSETLNALWDEVKHYFQTFEDWFSQKHLYHYIGFLVAFGHKIPDLMCKAKDNTKNKFTEYLRGEIRNLVPLENEKNEAKNDSLKKRLAAVEYGNDELIRRILLLFNIESIVKQKGTAQYFPFDIYNGLKWDIEHVRSQTEMEVNKSSYRRWALNILEYFTGVDMSPFSPKKNKAFNATGLKEVITEYVSQGNGGDDTTEALNPDRDELSLCDDLLQLLQKDAFDEKKTEKLYKRVQAIFREDDEYPEINSIANLALLDAGTNRSYKNSMFPIKRRIIIEKSNQGVFIPQCTQKMFLKQYSVKLGNLMYWQKSDADAYLEAMAKCLADFYPDQEQEIRHAE